MSEQIKKKTVTQIDNFRCGQTETRNTQIIIVNTLNVKRFSFSDGFNSIKTESAY